MTEDSTISLDASVETQHIAAATVCALVLASYATWITADLTARWLIFPAILLIAGYFLVQQADQRAQVVFLGYGMAVLVALTPIFMILSDVLSAGTYGRSPASMVVTTMNLLFILLFAVLAGIIAYGTYRYDGGTGIVQRIRERRTAEDG